MWMISLETPTALFFEGFLRGFEAQNWELEPHLLLVRPQLDACWRGLLLRAHPSCCFFAPALKGAFLSQPLSVLLLGPTVLGACWWPGGQRIPAPFQP